MILVCCVAITYDIIDFCSEIVDLHCIRRMCR